MKSMMSISVVWYTAKIHFFCFSWKTVCAIFIHNSNNNNEGTNRKNSVFFVLFPPVFLCKISRSFSDPSTSSRGTEWGTTKGRRRKRGRDGGRNTNRRSRRSTWRDLLSMRAMITSGLSVSMKVSASCTLDVASSSSAMASLTGSSVHSLDRRHAVSFKLRTCFRIRSSSNPSETVILLKICELHMVCCWESKSCCNWTFYPCAPNVFQGLEGCLRREGIVLQVRILGLYARWGRTLQLRFSVETLLQ